MKFIDAHKFCGNNKSSIGLNDLCGCFFCLRTFKGKDIMNWIGKTSAQCPYCTIDSVICETSGYEISESFLKAMGRYWFGHDWTE